MSAEPRHALDSAMTTDLYIEDHWRGASDGDRYATRGP